MDSAIFDLIATDPPFNTNRDFIEFNDKWDGVVGYMEFMRPRLLEMHRLLKDTGSLYLHCDASASHYLKIELDKIFGIDKFRNEVVWCYTKASRNTLKQYARSFDTILFYTKSDDWTFNPKQIRIPYPNGAPHAKQALIKTGETIKEWKARKESEGMTPPSWWVGIPAIHTQHNERMGYPTQKPVKLYERIIQASSNPKDMILDPFCGSGTTLVAANKHGRYYIGIDANEKAIAIAEERLQQQTLFT